MREQSRRLNELEKRLPKPKSPSLRDNENTDYDLELEAMQEEFHRPQTD